MTKRISGILFLTLALLSGCQREIMREQQNASLPLTETQPIDLNASIAQAKADGQLSAYMQQSDKRPTTRPTGIVSRIASLFVGD